MVGAKLTHMIEKIKDFYFSNYKKFLFIPFIVFLICLGQIIYQTHTTGDFINKDISLKGGITLTVSTSVSNVDLTELEEALKPQFAPHDLSIRTAKTAANQVGLLIESDIPELSQEKLNDIISVLSTKLGKQLTKSDYSLETMGSALGQSFFNQTVRQMFIAFIFMGIVVFIAFRVFIPCMAVISSAVSDIICTIAVVNVLEIKIGTAGIAALLMLIGYSVDTDILLTSKVLKRKDADLRHAVSDAVNTGLTMTFTTIAAVTIGIIFTQSEVIREIMTILLIGLVFDLLNTWLQNTGLILWYVEYKEKKKMAAK